MNPDGNVVRLCKRLGQRNGLRYDLVDVHGFEL
jgi:hypothetical protein